jgi:hypothetical protein
MNEMLASTLPDNPTIFKLPVSDNVGEDSLRRNIAATSRDTGMSAAVDSDSLRHAEWDNVCPVTSVNHWVQERGLTN